MFHLAICDDEPRVLEELSARLTSYMETSGFPCQISCFTSGMTLLEQNPAAIDILFLDIRMQPFTGMEIAHTLRQQGYAGLLIFLTVLPEYVFDVFAVQAFDYLLKPINANRLQHTLQRAIAQLSEQQKQKQKPALVIQSRHSCTVVPFEQILYGEVFGRKVCLHPWQGEPVTYYQKLTVLEQNVDQRFFRCHRSYLVNLDYVCRCQTGTVTLSDGSILPVARLREKELIRQLMARLTEKQKDRFRDALP